MLARTLLAEEFMGAEIRAAQRAEEARHRATVNALREEKAREGRLKVPKQPRET